MVLTAAIWGFLSAFTLMIPFRARFHFIKQWAVVNSLMLKWICGLKYEIEGRENIPDGACIIMAKHASTWETIFLQRIFAPVTWVLKKSLIRIPFFGWGLAALEPVAIDRSLRKKAMEQVIEQGTARLKKGWNLAIFPEGTRIAPGKMGKFKLGGARLAVASGFPAVPVAHNAGEFWPRHSFLKYPGTIRMVIGKPVDPKGKTPEEVNAEVHEFIVREMQRITTLDSHETGGLEEIAAGK